MPRHFNTKDAQRRLLLSLALAAVSCADSTGPRLAGLDVIQPLLDPRSQPAVALLPDGRLLIAGGGLEDGTVLASAEILDPVSGSSHHTACVMHIGRRRAIAATLADGRVLIIGGDTGNLFMLVETEIFDPATECFVDGPPLLERRQLGGIALTLHDGRVLIIKGFPLVRPPPAGGAEIYNPATNQFTLLNRDLGRETEIGAAAVLSDGRVLLVGGEEVPPSGNIAGLSDRAFLFDPATNTFTELAAHLSMPREDMALAADGHGGAFIIGGGGGIATDLIERFASSSLSFKRTDRLRSPRLLASTVNISGWTLVIGGKPAFGRDPLATTEWLSPSGERRNAGPTLAQGVAIGQHAFVLPDGRIAVLRTAGDPPHPWNAALLLSSPKD